VTTRTFGGVYAGSASCAKIALFHAVIVYQVCPAISEQWFAEHRHRQPAHSPVFISKVLPGCTQAAVVARPEIPAQRPITLTSPRGNLRDYRPFSASLSFTSTQSAVHGVEDIRSQRIRDFVVVGSSSSSSSSSHPWPREDHPKDEPARSCCWESPVHTSPVLSQSLHTRITHTFNHYHGPRSLY